MRTVLVTGAARRLGRAIALRLAGEGWAVGLHCHDARDEADALAGAIIAGGGRATVLQADLGDAAQTAALLPRLRERLGPVQALVNNASRFDRDNWDDFVAEGWDRHMDVNLRAPALLSQDLARGLPEGDAGVIVNLIDQKVWNLNPDFFTYTVSKMALEALTRFMARTLYPRVRVIGVAPGLTLPSGSQTEAQFERIHGRAPLGRGSTPDDIADAVAFAVGMDGLTGETLIVDGGQHLRRSPRDVMFLAAEGEHG